jgi:hypothetical protein
MRHYDTQRQATPMREATRRRKVAGTTLAAIILSLLAGLGLARPAEAGAVFFRCSGGFVVTSSNAAMVVNDATWHMDINLAVATLSDGSEVDVPFERVAGSRSRLEWVIGELPAGTVSVFIRYGLSQHLPDGTVEYWGDPRGLIEHHAVIGADCVAPLPAGGPTTTTTTTTPSTVPPTSDNGVDPDGGTVGGSTPAAPAGSPRPVHQAARGGSLPITGSALIIPLAALVVLLGGGGVVGIARRRPQIS